MKDNRRNFLKLSSFTGLSMVGGGILKGFAKEHIIKQHDEIPHTQRFNMSGYSVFKLDIVRVGFIGLGHRGPSHLKNMTKLEGVEIKALCDIRPEYANRAKESLQGSIHNPSVYSGNKEEWKKLCDRNDIDLIFIATPWDMHTPMAVYAMEQGKHVCIEVPAAVTIQECWQLVETSERTRRHCMMMENCCYDFFELLTLNMARQGFFGEIVHGEGSYIHNLLGLNFDKNGYWEMWRLKQNARRNGNLTTAPFTIFL